MTKNRTTTALALLVATATTAIAVTKQQLEEQFRKLPSVAEKDLPKFTNKRTPFRGAFTNSALRGYTYVTFPFVENPGSFGFDHQGRMYVAETHRFWLGTPDLRGKNMLVRGDFQSRTTEDRAKLYEEYSYEFPEGWFTAVGDRIVRLEDRDGNGAADHRTDFSGPFNDPLDGIGFSVLSDGESIYFTCIPNVWKLTDKDGDGIAESREKLLEGFGTQVSFIGHDMHGLVWGPDGKLYFSIGDRGYNVTSKEGRNFANPCRGAIFRCNPDGTEFEVFCQGLRNPQELAFDDYGNLFTFDNTGDIGDLARMVYALEGSDSGWHMSHQSPHHYAEILDWGEFRPKTSMWVAERMFDTYNEEQPQWVYPPASHVARGPSGVTYLTGDSIPENLRNTFLLANYRGAAPGCTVLTIRVEPSGAGFKAVSEETTISGIGVTDVEQGFDGRIYLCDFGGGWSVNQNGSIQVLEATDPEARKAGEQVGELFARGFDKLREKSLLTFLGHADKRVRQQAQFELAKRDRWTSLLAVLKNTDRDRLSRLHALWGLGQIAARSPRQTAIFTKVFKDKDPVLRANAARIIGEVNSPGAKRHLITALNDSAPQVRSLAAVALGKVAPAKDKAAIAALFILAGDNEDIVVRHSCIAALEQLNAEAAAIANANSKSREARLVSVIVLRRLASPALAKFLDDTDPLVRTEAIRAIYDTDAIKTPAGPEVANLASIGSLPETVQRRIVAANFHLGEDHNAGRLLDMAADASLELSVREAALQGLRKWTTPPVTDPVHGHYRPLKDSTRDAQKLVAAIGNNLGRYLAQEKTPRLLALGLRLADEIGVNLARGILEPQALNPDLDAEVRIATLDSLVNQFGSGAEGTTQTLLADKNNEVRAAAVRHAFAIGAKDVIPLGRKAVKSEKLIVARAAVDGLAKADTPHLLQVWNQRTKGLKKGLLLDVYLALAASDNEAATKAAETFAEASTTNVFSLSEVGGDIKRGKFVFENHGACLQCHKVKDIGGIQGPALDDVGRRLTRNQVLESVYNPNAVITPGFASITATMKDDSIVMGRLKTEDAKSYHLILPDGSESTINKSDIFEKTPLISAMPPIGAALAPRDLRDVVAYLVNLDGTSKKKEAEGH
jgi:quinoprotein glucose dehydrogenase